MVRAINRPGMYGDGNTLYLRVAPGGSKHWIQRLTINGKRHDIGLGGCGYVTLAQAREAAHENRTIARRGGDPLAVKRQARGTHVPRSRQKNLRNAATALAKQAGRKELDATTGAPCIQKARHPAGGPIQR